MKRLRYAAIFTLAFCLFLLLLSGPSHAAPPPDPAQQRPDIFPCNGCTINDRDRNGTGDMQDLNPTTLKAKQTRAVSYRLELRPGCNAGSMPADLERMNVHAREAVGLNITRNDSSFDFKVYISCGIEQINKCGGVNVFCLPDGFPYNTDVYMSDVMSGYQEGSKLGISLHEILGHAVGTWNEQYASCGSSCGFASTPNLSDFMNTGPLSRHGFSVSELGRWERTMWSLQAACVTPVEGIDGCNPDLYRFADGWAYRFSDQHWINRDGWPEWQPCNIFGERWNYHLGLVMKPGSSFYSRGFWSSAGAC